MPISVQNSNWRSYRGRLHPPFFPFKSCISLDVKGTRFFVPYDAISVLIVGLMHSSGLLPYMQIESIIML